MSCIAFEDPTLFDRGDYTAFFDRLTVQLPATCPCDWNASGAVDSLDFFDFLAAFFSGAADVNKDGGTDSGDFFDFLACFFEGC